jgi:hypothetical protein
MGYTTAEKRAALSALTQQDLTFSRNAFQGRNTSSTYSQLRELVLTGLYYEPDAVFALIDVAADYWASQVSAQRTRVANLRQDVSYLLTKDRTFQRLDVLRRAKTTVGRARVTAAAQAKVGTRPLERYRRLVDIALQDMAKQTVQSGAAIDSGQGRQVVKARTTVQRSLASDFRALQGSHATLRDGLDYLAGAFEAYVSSEALAKLSLTQLERLDDMVGDVVEALETLDNAGSREVMRQYFLDLLGGQAIARRLEERRSPTEPRIEVTAGYRLTASTPATPPSITGSVSSPWPLEQAASDVLEVDFSGTTVSVDLVSATDNEVGIEAAELVGSTFEPFRVVSANTNPVALFTKKITSGGTYSVNGTNLYLMVDGATHTVAFGSNQTAAQVASTINGALSDVFAIATTGGGQDWVRISYINPSPPDQYDQRSMSVVSGLNDATDLAPWRLDGPSGEVAGTRSFGADQRNTLKLYANDDATTTTITLTPGVWPDYERTADEVRDDINTAGGTAFEAVSTGDRITIKSKLKGEGSLIRIATDGLSGDSKSVSQRTLEELGFVEYLESRQSDIPMSQVLAVLNANTAFTAEAVASSLRTTLYEARAAEVTGSNTLRFDVGTFNPSTGWDVSTIKAAIATGGNQGTYTVDSVSYSTPYLTLTLDRDLRDQTAASRFNVSVISERLKLTSLDTTEGTYLQVQSPAASADGKLGFALTRVTGTTTTVLIEIDDPVKGWTALDLRPYSIRSGDTVYNVSGTLVATVTGVSQVDQGLLSVTAVDSDFSLTTGFTIKSGSQEAYRAFALALAAFRRGFTTFEDDTLSVIGNLLLPQLRNKQPARDQVIAVGTKLDEYDTELAALETVLTDYSVTQPSVVRQAFRVMQEHGHDRARQLLLQGDLGTFLGLSREGASKSQHLMTQLNTVATADVNEPTRYDDEEEGNFERAMVGYEEDDNPAFEVEDEEQWPDSPLSSYPEQLSSAVELEYTPTARGGKR